MALAATLLSAKAAPEPLRIGIIGLDTSHVPAFIRVFNDPRAEGDFVGMRIVAGYPGGTQMPASRNRVERFTQAVRDSGIEIVHSIPELLQRVDVVLLESVDGRVHLEEAIPVIRAKKALFIDKPVAGTLADAVAIYALAERYGVPCFSSSALRFSQGVRDLGTKAELGDIRGVLSWGPCDYEPGTPDLFFYGIHGVEPLFTLMGTGCIAVTRWHTDDVDLVSGVWSDGRSASYRGFRRAKGGFGVVAFGSLAVATAPNETLTGYRNLCREIARFFRTGVAPVSPDETLEILAFMEAADESKRQGGKAVLIADVLAKAKREVAARKIQ